jgi:hypothetical protein
MLRIAAGHTIPPKAGPRSTIKISMVVTQGTTGEDPVHFSLNESQDYDCWAVLQREKGRRRSD